MAPSYILPEQIKNNMNPVTPSTAAGIQKTTDTITKINDLVTNGNKLMENIQNVLKMRQSQESTATLSDAQIQAKAEKIAAEKMANFQGEQSIVRVQVKPTVTIRVHDALVDLRAMIDKQDRSQTIDQCLAQINQIDNTTLEMFITTWINKYIEVKYDN